MDSKILLTCSPETLGEEELIFLGHQAKIMQNGSSQDKLESKRIFNLLKTARQVQSRNPKIVNFSDLFNDFSEKQIDAIGETLSIIQLTSGCSVGCPDCNFNALKNVRARLSFDAISEIIDRFGSKFARNSGFCYYASDPLDWVDETGRTYLDIQNMIANKTGGFYPQITTAVPKGSENLLKELWKSPVQVRISISNVNSKRISAAFLDELGDPGNSRSDVLDFFNNNFAQNLAGASYDYSTIDNSIGCRNGTYLTPEGLWSIITTLTSPLYPNGFERFKLDSNSKQFIKSSCTAHDKSNWFQPLEIIDEGGLERKMENLIDAQLFNAIYSVMNSSGGISNIANWVYGEKKISEREWEYFTSLPPADFSSAVIKFRDQDLKDSDIRTYLTSFRNYLKRESKAQRILYTDLSSNLSPRVKKLDDTRKKNNNYIMQCLTTLLVLDSDNYLVNQVINSDPLPIPGELMASLTSYV